MARQPRQQDPLVADQENRSLGAPEGSPVLEAPENTEGREVQSTSVYSETKEWPKWMYHRNGESKVFDSAAEFAARAPGNPEDWSPNPHAFGPAGGLRSPATGGASDPAIRAAANPVVPATDEPARLPRLGARRDRVELAPFRMRDPQREQAIEDASGSVLRDEEVDAATGQPFSELNKGRGKR
jgi:hypothetical protein